ncbi:hypothetical protein [Pseudomonas sp. B33.4]|uniref:hypothetical protein n=1 Tax=Pseudomonas sp. B33.4 TaxID=3104265 RepID=UPI002ADECA75|nr:hypothetical protein [Pseudomonas sp. B33.4]
MNKKIMLCSWVAAISIAQVLIDKVFFPENEKIGRRESELYQPMSELQYKQQQVIRIIRDREYINQLDPGFGQKTVDQKYMNTLLDYHREMVNLYDITTSKTLLFSISEMATDVAKMSKDFGLCIQESQREEFFKATMEIIPLTEKMLQTKSKIIDFDTRVRAAEPDRDAQGNLVVEAASKHLKMIIEFMKDPDLLIRVNKEETPLNDIDKFVEYYNVIHLGYGDCTRAYSEESENSANYKLFYQIIIFLLLTYVIYRKDML